MKLSDILDKLRDDEQYYGEFGRQYLSNSDIGNLLKTPYLFGVSREDNPVFAKGRYFHQSILEPEKVKDFPFIDVGSRNSIKYKEAIKDADSPFLLLKKEVDEIKTWVDALVGNIELYDKVRNESARYEVPGVAEIYGLWWKGKADIETDDCLYDLKTTGDIMKFRRSARDYNYDSQAYIYQTIFGKPLEFIAIDKSTRVLGHFTCSDDFIMQGKAKLEAAVEVYNQYFRDGVATHDISEYIIRDTL